MQSIKTVIFYISILCMCAINLSFCFVAEKGEGSVKKFNDPIVLQKQGRYINDVSLFLAGLKLPENSKLYPFTKNKRYKRYVEILDKRWKKYTASNIQKISAWRDKFLPAEYNRTIFYPFSGPDLLYPLIFFPRGNDIVMFGLESPGKIPDPLSLPKSRVIGNFRGVMDTLGFILGHSFFITNNMAKKIGRTSYTGITGIMMLFLARSGYTVAGVNKIRINSRGEIVKKVSGRKGYIRGVEIIFYKNNKKNLKRVRFFSFNVENRSGKLPFFLAHMKRYTNFSTMVKSASYLMHLKSFSKIRSMIINKSNSILQDDSGIPSRIFSPKIWHISYHGYYHKPIPVFKHYMQKNLQKKIKKHTTGKLPFSYGYGYGYKNITYHLIYAVKQKKQKKN